MTIGYFIFANQPQITPQNLRGMTERFAADNKVTFPFVVDPSGEFAAKVKADYAIGQRVGIEHTPTIYVVSDTTRGTPFVEVVDRTQLYQLIDKVIKGSRASSARSQDNCLEVICPEVIFRQAPISWAWRKGPAQTGHFGR